MAVAARKLQADDLHAEIDALYKQIAELSADLDKSQASCSALDEEVADLKQQLRDAEDSDLEGAVDSFLDEVERPVGKITFIVPQHASVDRAILRLFDASGRSI